MIHLACHLSGLGANTLDGTLGTSARLGFRSVDLPSTLINLGHATAQPVTEAATIRNVLSEFSLAPTDFDLSLPEFNAPDETKRQAALNRFDKLLPFLSALKVPG